MFDAMLVEPTVQFRSGMLKDLADTLQPLGIRLDCQTFDPTLSAVRAKCVRRF